jgi:hypothetical protein
MSASAQISQKSVDAALAAIEIYNKPDFRHREETFAILMTNAWELLLKAKFILDHSDDPSSVIEYEAKSGGKTPKLNRSGNPITFGLTYLLERFLQEKVAGFTKPCYENILLLIEIRDNSIHFIHKDLFFSKRIQEIGTASLRSFVAFCQDWFSHDLSRYNFYLMPLSFYHGFETVQSMSVSNYNDQTKRLLEYLAAVESEHPSDASSQHNVTLRLETKFVRSNSADAIAVRFSSDPNTPAITVREEDVLRNFPFSYHGLCKELHKRYSNFLENQRYHDIRKPLEKEKKFCLVRLLDPQSPKSGKKAFYSPEILKEFDKYYKKKKDE